MSKTTLPEPETKPLSLRHAGAFSVDVEAGALTDLVLMEGDREAKGHGIWIDAITLEGFLAAVTAKGGRLKGYQTHDHDGPATWGPMASELEIPGFFSNLEIRNNQIVAGRFEFFDHFKEEHAADYKKLMEFATKTPDLIGLSAEFWYSTVYVGTDGTEYRQRPEDIELANGGMRTVRVHEVWAAAFVSDGAATDGLFAKFGAKVRQLFGDKRPTTEEIAHLHASLEDYRRDNPDADAVHSARSIEDTSLSTKMKNATLQSIKTTYAEDSAKFSAAMTIFGNEPEIEFAALQSKLDAAALTAATAKAAALSTQVTTLETDLKAAKDATTAAELRATTAEAKFTAIKESGADPLNLGPQGGDNAEGNPFAKATFNETKQVELHRKDPARAAALKTAADNGTPVPPLKKEEPAK